jgi:cobalt/nickel transport system permease protein
MLQQTLRYLELLLDEAARMNRARSCRGDLAKLPFRKRTQAFGNMVGTLFLRTLARAERIQQAMRCRGHGLPLVHETDRRLTISETVLLTLAVSVTVGAVLAHA